MSRAERIVLVPAAGVLLAYLLFGLPYKGMQLTYLWEDPEQVDAKRGGLVCAPADVGKGRDVDASAVGLGSPYTPQGVWYELDLRRTVAETGTIVVLTAAAWVAVRRGPQRGSLCDVARAREQDR